VKHLIVCKLRVASHYGRSSREAMGMSGQTLLRVQRNRLKIVNKMIYLVFDKKKKIDIFSTIVWVSTLVWSKLSSRVCSFGPNLSQKVMPCWTTTFRLLPLMWRVERLNSLFLAISSVEIDGLLTFGHSVKWSLWYDKRITYTLLSVCHL